MSANEPPTLYTLILTINLATEGQVLCVEAFKVVCTLSFFDDSLFEQVDLYQLEVNHLLSWCVEVLTADFWNSFTLNQSLVMK